MIYAIGDIHGHLRKLERLMIKMEEAGLGPSDRLVFVGDYIDRGPKVPELLDYLVDLKKRRPNDVYLRGNHDQGMLDARDVFDQDRTAKVSSLDIQWWFACGGRETVESYPPVKPWYNAVPDAHWEFLESTQMEYEEGNYLFVHAGIVPPGKKWKDKEDPRLWIRELFIGSKADFGKTVIFGHTPQDLLMPCVMANKVGIDTGAAYNGPLTALRLDPNAPYDMDRLHFLSAL
jgi:serine/threonine protein phosphatase 1